MRRTPIMLLGCTSDAGKSFLATALCRHLANRGVRVAPFKAQNMSNNAAVTPGGGEIGRAQHLQALAARVVPGVRMALALLLYPWASNLDEFDPLFHEENVNVVPIQRATPLDDFHAILLPGSKSTVQSFAHLRTSGLADEVVRAARRGAPVLGVCGGLQMLGKRIHDPDRIEGGDADGLGLLDVVTTLERLKTTRWTEVAWRDGVTLHGYEIHHGVTEPGPDAEQTLDGGLGFAQGNVHGVYLHGLFASSAFRQAFLADLGWRGRAHDWAARIDAEIERVARLVPESGWEP